MMIRRHHYIIVFLFLLTLGSMHAQVSEYEYKAAFIERFTRFVQWPNENDSSTFTIGVLGKNPFHSSLDELFDGIEIKHQKVEIIYTHNVKDLMHVNLVFISSSEKRILEDILSLLTPYPILIISDSKDFCQMGVHINMYLDNNYVRYEINQEAIEESQLKVSSLLLSSAKIVKTND